MTRLYHREMPCSTLDTVAKPLRNDIMLTGGRLMAALKVVEESPNQLVLGIPLAQRIPGLVVSLGIFLLIGYSTLSGLLQGTIGEDPSSLLVLLFLGFFLLRSVSSAVITTTVKIDGSARLATRSTSLLGISTGQVALPLDHVRRVIVGSRAPVGFSQARTRSGWLVTLDSPDGPPFVANWNGTHDEMLSFGNKIGTLVNKPLVDELERARAQIQTAPDGQPIQDFSGGGSATYAPPVAVPSIMGGRTPASQLPDKTPPPNTLTADSESVEHARFEQEASQTASSSNESAPMAEPMPPPTFMSPPALELPNQAPMESVTYAPTAIPAEPSAPVVSAPSVPARMRSVEELQKAIADDPTDSVAYLSTGSRAPGPRGFGSSIGNVPKRR